MNLAYLQSTRFHFALTCWPGSKNTKLDVLSCQFSADQPDPDPGPILLPFCTMGLVGPFEVDRMVNMAVVRLKLPASINVHLTFHVSWVKPVSPMFRNIDGAPAYTLRCILYVRQRGQGFQFLVDWEGYGPEEWSWVPRRHILDQELLRSFYWDHLQCIIISMGI